MIEYRLNVDVMGNARFAFSPLTEAISSLRLLTDPRPPHLHRPWLELSRQRLAGHDLGLLLALAPPGRFQVEFLTAASLSPTTTVEDQLEDLLDVSPEQIRSELELVWGDRGLPDRARELIAAGPAGPELMVDAFREYWDVAIEQHWSRMRAVLEEDVAHRAARALQGGLFELLSDLHPEVSVEAHTLRINKPHHADRAGEVTGLTLIPSVFAWPNLLVSCFADGTIDLVYGARGVGRVWERLDDDVVAEDHLGALLGRGRAAVLLLVRTPMSTTHIAEALDQSAGSVSKHLSVLRESGLVTSHRSGRSVLYVQTPLAHTLTEANEGPSRRLAGAMRWETSLPGA